MAQTPQQRKSNEKYAKREEAKRGKSEAALTKAKKFKSPISPIWLIFLGFVVFGGIMFELVRLFFS